MKRDMDLIRDLLLAIEDKEETDGNHLFQFDEKDDLGIVGHSKEQVNYHLVMLIESGLLKGEESYDRPIISKLTWQGHDFLDYVRDPEIWQKTKDGAKKAGGFSIELLGDLAKGFIKKKIEDHTGIKI